MGAATAVRSGLRWTHHQRLSPSTAPAPSAVGKFDSDAHNREAEDLSSWNTWEAKQAAQSDRTQEVVTESDGYEEDKAGVKSTLEYSSEPGMPIRIPIRFYSEPDLTIPVSLADLKEHGTVIYELRYGAAVDMKWNRIQKLEQR